jgi:hypothetical protein
MKTALVIALAVTFLSACSDAGHYQIAAAGGDQTHVWRLDTRSGEVAMCVVVQQRVRCVQSLTELSKSP